MAGPHRHYQDHGQHTQRHAPYHQHNRRHHHRSSHRPQSIEEVFKTDSLLSKEAFLQLAPPTDSDTKAAYEEYVHKHQQAFLVRFAERHGMDPWLISLYDSSTESSNSNEAIQARLEFFIENIQRRRPCLNLEAHEDSLKNIYKREGRLILLGEDVKLPDHLIVPQSSEKRQLYVNNVPPNADPESLLTLIRTVVPHADNLVLSNPVPSKGFIRSGWLALNDKDPDTDPLYPEVRLLDGISFNSFALSFYPRDRHVRIKLVCSKFNDEARVKRDLWISQELITSMNVARRIAFDMTEFHSIKDDKERLDLQIMFLRTVHWVCYYSAYEAACPEELSRHCGDLVLRDNEDVGNVEDLTLFDKKIQLLIDRGYRSLGLKAVTVEERLLKHMEQLEEQKFKCADCGKLFKGPEFVLKHLALKHEEIVTKEKDGLSMLNRILELPHFLLIPNSMIVRGIEHVSSRRPSNHRPYSSNPSYHNHRRENEHTSSRPPYIQHDRPSVRREYFDYDAPSASGSIDISYDL